VPPVTHEVGATGYRGINTINKYKTIFSETTADSERLSLAYKHTQLNWNEVHHVVDTYFTEQLTDFQMY